MRIVAALGGNALLQRGQPRRPERAIHGEGIGRTEEGAADPVGDVRVIAVVRDGDRLVKQAQPDQVGHLAEQASASWQSGQGRCPQNA